jgi:hypothetical protein
MDVETRFLHHWWLWRRRQWISTIANMSVLVMAVVVALDIHDGSLTAR